MKLTQLARTAVLVVAIGASVIATATSAQACAGRGDHFLASLESHGINADPDTALHLAEAVCSGLAEGETYDTMIDQGAADTGLSAEDFAYVVEQSVVYFCPEFSDKLPD